MTKSLIKGGIALLAAFLVCAPQVAHAGADEDALAKIEYDFADMQITKDAGTIERVSASMDKHFRFTDPTVHNLGASKEQMLKAIKSDKVAIISTVFQPFSIRIFGSTAILEGVNSSVGTVAGKDISGAFAWTDVFEKRQDRWMWLFSQSGKIGDRVSDKDTCKGEACSTLHAGFSLKA